MSDDQPVLELAVRVTTVTASPRADLFFHATQRRLEVVVTEVDELTKLQQRALFVFEHVEPAAVDQLARLLELLQVPVAVFVDR